MNAMKVFVYGTLKRGGVNHPLLSRAKFLREFELTGNYKMFSYGGFPAVVYDRDYDISTIHGEVFEIDEETLGRLDTLEGHPDFYYRELHNEGFFIYLMEKHKTRGASVVKDGNWVNKFLN